MKKKMRTKAEIVFGGHLNYAGVATNTANAITITFANDIIKAYSDGFAVKIKMDATTDGNATFNINGIGAKKVYKGSDQTDQVDDEMIEDHIYTLTYNSSLDTASGGFVVGEL